MPLIPIHTCSWSLWFTFLFYLQWHSFCFFWWTTILFKVHSSGHSISLPYGHLSGGRAGWRGGGVTGAVRLPAVTSYMPGSLRCPFLKEATGLVQSSPTSQSWPAVAYRSLSSWFSTTCMTVELSTLEEDCLTYPVILQEDFASQLVVTGLDFHTMFV